MSFFISNMEYSAMPPPKCGFCDSRNLLHSSPHHQFVCPLCHASFPFSFALFDPYRLQLHRSQSLIQVMNSEGLIPSIEQEMKRRNAIEKLKKIVMQWVKRVAHRHRFSKSNIKEASATILTYGSYGLGVHDYKSDLDALCVGPYFATLDVDFFVTLRSMLACRPEVSKIICIKEARVPLMRFNFDGFSVDLPYAKLNMISIPENVDLLNPLFLTNIDDISWRSLSGVRANKSILQLVPNLEVYQSLLRCVKLWAKRRGIYGHAFGFFGGVHLAVLAAFVCWRHPDTHLSSMASIFFETFASWPWPTPVILGGEGVMTPSPDCMERVLMSIKFPCCPVEYCYSNITRSTFKRIKRELCQGHALLTKDALCPDFQWKVLFEPFLHAKEYGWFLKIRLSSREKDKLGEWVGWVKSRIRYLLIKVEEVVGFCDPNPNEYSDGGEPNVVFYWGLSSLSVGIKNGIGAIKADFMRNISEGHPPAQNRGRMDLTLVAATELPKPHHY